LGALFLRGGGEEGKGGEGKRGGKEGEDGRGGERKEREGKGIKFECYAREVSRLSIVNLPQ